VIFNESKQFFFFFKKKKKNFFQCLVQGKNASK
jgi:hypothetical protein